MHQPHRTTDSEYSYQTKAAAGPRCGTRCTRATASAQAGGHDHILFLGAAGPFLALCHVPYVRRAGGAAGARRAATPCPSTSALAGAFSSRTA